MLRGPGHRFEALEREGSGRAGRPPLSHLFAGRRRIVGGASVPESYTNCALLRMIVSATPGARGTSVASSTYSSGLCVREPTGPTAHNVGAPTPAENPASEQPPVKMPVTVAPSARPQSA